MLKHSWKPKLLTEKSSKRRSRRRRRSKTLSASLQPTWLEDYVEKLQAQFENEAAQAMQCSYEIDAHIPVL
eukprot:5353124-Amphidinium_carterae.1